MKYDSEAGKEYRKLSEAHCSYGFLLTGLSLKVPSEFFGLWIIIRSKRALCPPHSTNAYGNGHWMHRSCHEWPLVTVRYRMYRLEDAHVTLNCLSGESKIFSLLIPATSNLVKLNPSKLSFCCRGWEIIVTCTEFSWSTGLVKRIWSKVAVKHWIVIA